MIRRHVLVAAMLVWASRPVAGAETPRRPVRPAEPPASLLWVAAHPDDEVLAAPLLARECVGKSVRCTFLILTRGERGECLLPEGCEGDLREIRGAETGYASGMYGANLILLGLPDGGGKRDAGETQWDGVMGGRQPLMDMITRYIQAVAPDIILTFDPRHGTTCHTDHRLAGELVLQATDAMTHAPAVVLLETQVSIHDEAPLRLEFGVSPMMRPIVQSLDANAETTGTATGWDWLLETMRVHSSQFDDEWLDAARNVPPAERRIHWASAAAALAVPIPGCP